MRRKRSAAVRPGGKERLMKKCGGSVIVTLSRLLGCACCRLVAPEVVKAVPNQGLDCFVS